MGFAMPLLVTLVLATLLLLPFAVVWLLVRVRRLEREVSELRLGRGAWARSSSAPGASLAESEQAAAIAAPGDLPLPAPESTAPAFRGREAPAGIPAGIPAGSPAEIPAEAPAARPVPVAARESAPRRIEWERWLGVRGAGLLGGIFAALAAVLLFRHAIQEGWITPAMRVTLGLVAGLGLAGAGEWLRPRGYRHAPESLIGAGAVAHYASIWAAGERYGFWPVAVSFALMALVTAAACALALRHRSNAIAAIALAGGFATPILLAGEEDRPLGLFGYLLLLNLGLLMVGRRLVAPWVGLAALGGTALLQGLWLGARYRAGGEVFALAMLALFAALFAFQPRPKGTAQGMAPTQAVGLLLPFVFAAYVADRGGLELDLAPLALFAGLLLAASCVLSRQAGLQQLPLGAVAGTAILLSTWMAGRSMDAPAAWGLAAAAPLLALVPHAFLLHARRRTQGREDAHGNGDEARGLPGPGSASSLSALALGAVLLGLAAKPGTAPFAPLVVGFAGLHLLALARAWAGAGSLTLPALALLAGLALPVYLGAQDLEHGPGAAGTALGLLAFAALGLVGAVLLRARGAAGRAALAAGLFPLLPLVLQAGFDSLGPPVAPLRLLTVSLLSLAALAGALAGRWATLLGAALVATTLALLLPYQTVLDAARESAIRPWSVAASLVAPGLLLAAAFALAPFAFGGRIRSRAACWIAGAAPLLLAWALGPAVRGLGWHAGEPWLPAAFLVVALGSWGALRGRFEEARSSHGLVVVWLGALTLALVLQIEPALVFLGLFTAGAALLWRRTGHVTVKLAGLLAALGALFVALAQFAAPGHYPRAGTVLLNGLAFAHAVAALGTGLLAGVLARGELARLAPWEDRVARGRPYGLALGGLAAAGILFLWLTLTVIELWSSGPRVASPSPRVPAFDLTLSSGWAGYGLALLAFGLWRRSAGPRWASLLVLLLTIGKVFLRDLGHLEGLARVGSLAALALSLTLVSLLYQRFVFGRRAAP